MMLNKDINKEEIFEYLDKLRESAVTNMFGAYQYIEEVYDLSRDDAKQVLLEWMGSFEERQNIK